VPREEWPIITPARINRPVSALFTRTLATPSVTRKSWHGVVVVEDPPRRQQ